MFPETGARLLIFILSESKPRIRRRAVENGLGQSGWSKGKSNTTRIKFKPWKPKLAIGQRTQVRLDRQSQPKKKRNSSIPSLELFPLFDGPDSRLVVRRDSVRTLYV